MRRRYRKRRERIPIRHHSIRPILQEQRRDLKITPRRKDMQSHITSFIASVRVRPAANRRRRDIAVPATDAAVAAIVTTLVVPSTTATITRHERRRSSRLVHHLKIDTTRRQQDLHRTPVTISCGDDQGTIRRRRRPLLRSASPRSNIHVTTHTCPLPHSYANAEIPASSSGAFTLPPLDI